MNRKQGNSALAASFQVIAGFCALAPTGMALGETLALVSPHDPLPLVVFSEQEVEYYGNRVKVHRDAAADLCDYLSRVTGREIRPGSTGLDAAVVLHVGPDEFSMKHAPEIRELYADGFLLKHVSVEGKHHVILSGIRSLSSRWAVEEFLKQFAGVRWLFPGDAAYGEIVPSRPTLTIESGLNQRHEPDYISRTNCGMHYYTKGGLYLRARPSEGWGYGSHEFQVMFTRKHYEAHPEWFSLFTIPQRWVKHITDGWPAASESVKDALARGVRRQRWHWDYGNGWQVCTSNPETVRHAAAYARDYFAQHADSPVVSMGHNDTGGWCECDTCKAFIASADPPYTVSEQYWHWVNQVAKELSGTHPDKKITTIAYGAPAIPPRFPLEKNVSVMLTVYVEGHLDLARKWREKCDAVDLYSYAWGSEFLGFRHYPHAMRDFLKWGHDELGAVSHVTEVYGDWSFDGPKYHYMQALMWDVNADPDRIMQDYCRDWFGAAAGSMRAFWDRLEQVYERRGHPRRILFYQWIGWQERYDELDLYTLDDVSVLDRAIADAERTAGTEADRYRVARVADAWKYYRTFLLGKLKYADRQESVLADAADSFDRGLQLARELAEIQSQRRSFFRQLRAYPRIREPRPPRDLTRRALQLVAFNPQITRAWYLGTFEYVSTFSDMRTILDDLCDELTKHQMEEKGRGQAESFWSRVGRADPLYASGRRQLGMIRQPARPNLLVNGDFETGNLDGWEVRGEVAVVDEASSEGGHAARATGAGSVTLTQKVPVRYRQRYRLTVRGRYETLPKPAARGFSTDVRFEGSGKPRHEPNFRRLQTDGLTDRWHPLRTTFTVPQLADTAVISITSSGSPLLLDDLTLEKIQDGPVVEPGVVADDFSDKRLNESIWMESSAGHGGFMPAVNGGALVFDHRPMATVVSLASFDDLLGGDGAQRYRLRLHVSTGDDKTRDGFLEYGINTDTVSLTTDNSGLYFAHGFSVPGQRKNRIMALWPSVTIKTYWHQDSTFTGGSNFNIPLKHAAHEVWYTIYFSRKNATLFAGHDGYDESAEARIGEYEHGMTDMASKGPVFLKLSGSNVKINEVSLLRPVPEVSGPDVTEPIPDPFMR